MSEESKDVKIKLESEIYASTTANDVSDHIGKYLVKACFQDGATSNSAREYWYKQFEKENIDFAISDLSQELKGKEIEKYKLEFALEELEDLITSKNWESNDFALIYNKSGLIKEKLNTL